VELTRGLIWAERTGGGGSTARASFGGGRQWWMAAAARFRSDGGSAELVEGRRKFGKTLRGSGREGTSGVARNGRGERWRCSARVAHLVVSSRKRGEQLELATDVEESGEASRRDARRDGRRVATDVEKRRRLRRDVPSRGRDGVRAIS